jgi:hypothetical protein
VCSPYMRSRLAHEQLYILKKASRNCSILQSVPMKVNVSRIVSFRALIIFELSNESIDKIALRRWAGRRTGRGSVSVRSRDFSLQHSNEPHFFSG